MPSFADSVVIFFLALIFFGPKKLPELARQLGKLMGEFRRASTEFKMQMEEEMRITERAEQEKKIAALEAAAPPSAHDPAAPTYSTETALSGEQTLDYGNFNPHDIPQDEMQTAQEAVSTTQEAPSIATSGTLELKPPATGLPVAQAPNVAAEAEAVTSFTGSIPTAATEPAVKQEETPTHG